MKLIVGFSKCGVFVNDKVNDGWFLFYWELMLL